MLKVVVGTPAFLEVKDISPKYHLSRNDLLVVRHLFQTRSLLIYMHMYTRTHTYI